MLRWLRDAFKRKKTGRVVYMIPVSRNVGLKYDERTDAQVNFMSDVEGMTDTQARFRIMGAVTEWVETTKEGEHAWKVESSRDFNVGDLIENQHNADLRQLLEKRRIFNLEITSLSPRGEPWEYDDLLVAADDLSKAKQ